MKTVNFLEALEANKTRAVIIDDENRNRYNVNSLRELASTGRLDALYCAESQWQVEEVIEFECVFKLGDEGILINNVVSEPNYYLDKKMKSVYGKRTKVRIEVLGDE